MSATRDTWKEGPSLVRHPFVLGSLAMWLRVLRDNTVEPAYRARVGRILRTNLLTLLLQLYERARYGDMRDTPIHPAPIFVVGHWRSGTTHLHNILAADPELGYVTQFQAAVPGACIVGQRSIKPRMAARMPATRLLDNVALGVDTTQEEELAIAGLSPYSSYHLWSFPRRARALVERYMLFQQLPPREARAWASVYQTTLRKATYLAGGRRLVLKNPANTGRTPALLRLFPDAAFIHIHRNPYDIFRSMLRLYTITSPAFQLQDISPAEIEENVLSFYALMMRKLLADRAALPPQRFVELRFDDLEARPLACVRDLYARLDLPWSARQERAIREYINAQHGYQKNQHVNDPRVIARVDERWAFAFDAWGYEMRPAA